MKQDLGPTAPTPVIAAALRRRPRAWAGEGAKSKIFADNYIAEGRVTRRFRLKKRKKAGAKPGNFNAVLVPGRAPEDIALYHRIAGVKRRAKSIVHAINREFRARRQESKQA